MDFEKHCGSEEETNCGIESQTYRKIAVDIDWSGTSTTGSFKPSLNFESDHAVGVSGTRINANGITIIKGAGCDAHCYPKSTLNSFGT
jgi:hypothetical protein